MATQLQLRKGSTSANLNFTGAVGEVTVDTQKNELRVHDGSTVGGHVIYTKTDVDAALDLKANASTTLVGYGITDGANTDLSNLTSTGQDKFDAKANKAMNNLTTVGKNITNWSTNVTNCVTEIPQDIKLELNNGTLTLKTGSKIYVPNGADNFDIVTIAQDVPTTYSTDGQYLLIPTKSSLPFTDGYVTLLQAAPSTTVSGTTDSLSGTQWHTWYDITENKIKRYGTDTTTPSTYGALPVCLFTVSDGAISSIDQVFNGFGYIGSTAYVLPGVKGLIPNGINADGTLNNEETSITAVKTVTPTTSLNINKVSIILEDNGITYNGGYRYDEESNLTYDDTTLRPCCLIGSCTLTNSIISNFRTKKALRIFDHNDGDYIANCAMPSKRFMYLTLGVSGASYVAPADGWFYVAKMSTGFSEFLQIATASMKEQNIATATDQTITCVLPVSKGESASVYYSVGGTTSEFKFIYANGSNIL